MSVRLITGPVEEPVTLEQAKAHLRLDTALDDDYLESLLIPAARQYLERVCWRGFLLQTWEVQLGGFRGADRFDMIPEWRSGTQLLTSPLMPSAERWTNSDSSYRFMPYLELPRGHLAASPSVVITYLDENGVQQTLNAASYFVDTAGNDTRNGRIRLNSAGGYVWPNTLAQFNAVTVQYTVGWDVPADVPAPIRMAMLVLLAQMYEHRTPEIDGRLSEAEFTSTALCGPYRLLRL